MAFSYYSPITINNGQVPSTQTDFPVLISLTDARLKTVSNGGHVNNSGGFDIRPYSDATITTAITGYELVYYNGSTGTIEMWVKRSSVADGLITYLAYGDAGLNSDASSTTTWSNGFVGVSHLKDGTTLSVTDSTGINTSTNHGATAVTGKIDGGGGFASASSQYIDAFLNSPAVSAVTLSIWVNATSFPNAYNAPIGVASTSDEWIILVKSTGKLGVFFRATTLLSYDGTGTNTLSTGTWYYLTSTYSSATGLISYVNASVDATVAANGALNTGGTHTCAIGQDLQTAGRFWNGALDEGRVANVARTADWITTEYNNQNAPGTFQTLGAEVNLNPMAGLFGFTPVVFAPTDIAGCILWLKADSLVLNDGDPVSTWTDSSGNGNTFTGVTTTRPLYKTGIINSKPAVLFDGTDDFMTGPASLGTSGKTVFLVVQPTLNTASQKTYATFIHSEAGGGPGIFIVAKISTNFWGTFTNADLSSANALTSGSNYLLENTSASGSVFLYQGGVQVATTTGTTETNSGTNIGLGKDLGNANRQYAGYIAEAIWYNSVLSSGNRILVENYLIARYAL